MEPIQRSTGGAEFIKADLHVHTPGSHDYEEDISPGEFVEALEDEGIELVAVTDHDCSGWYQEVQEAAEETPIEVLPGVEITTPQGSEHQIHVTAIFPPEKASNVDFVLSNVGVNPAEPEGAQANQKIGRICEIVRHHGGLPILAHIDEKAGADYELDRNNPIKQEIFDPGKVAAIEVIDSEVKHQYPEFPAIQSSDAHSREELGRGCTYLKVTEPSFEGLRTALSDPDSRISFTEPNTSHAWITGIRCEGEFLDGRELQLNRNLNCLIGGKGTGKVKSNLLCNAPRLSGWL
jgi:predicted metal-dependent phosphoesterase TrpH